MSTDARQEKIDRLVSDLAIRHRDPVRAVLSAECGRGIMLSVV